MEHDIYKQASLLKKGLLDIADEDERKQLDELLEKQSVRETYEQLGDASFLKAQIAEYKKYPSEEAFQEFLARVGKRRKIHPAWWYGAAVVALFFVVFVWKNLMPIDRPEQSTQKTNTIKPGEKPAMLTLADGRIVEVSSENISIQEKNGAEINYAGGILSYNGGEKKAETAYNELNIPSGGEGCLILSDGTKVWLNADTKLRYPTHFSGLQREVYLEGEAYFDVVKNDNPFVVETSFGKVNVLGTSFCVHAYSEEEGCYTTLVKGRINFSTHKGASLEIAPGEQVTASKSGETEKRKVHIEEYVGWKDGIYIFREKPLGDIMKTVERWYDISVSFRDAELSLITFTGSFKRGEPISAFLDALSRTKDVHYTIKENKLILFK